MCRRSHGVAVVGRHGASEPLAHRAPQQRVDLRLGWYALAQGGLVATCV
ncbi:MAG: hypothetical protein QOD70_777, partial [Frankiales bacterium]|nr:hypothetical protein [Frankiales bacterium]